MTREEVNAILKANRTRTPHASYGNDFSQFYGKVSKAYLLRNARVWSAAILGTYYGLRGDGRQSVTGTDPAIVLFVTKSVESLY